MTYGQQPPLPKFGGGRPSYIDDPASTPPAIDPAALVAAVAAFLSAQHAQAGLGGLDESDPTGANRYEDYFRRRQSGYEDAVAEGDPSDPAYQRLFGGEAAWQARAEDAYLQDAERARQRYGMLQDGSPNTAMGGVVGQPAPGPMPLPDLSMANAGYQVDPAGTRYEDGSVASEDLVVQDDAGPAKPKKGKNSEFFALLSKMKAEEKDGGRSETRKAFKKLAKQLASFDPGTNATGSIQI